MADLYFRAEIVSDNGQNKLKVVTETLYKRLIDSLRLGTKLQVILVEEKNKRSISQNNYYWQYLTIIGNETGELPNELHEICKREFLPPVFKTIMGKEYKLPRSTTELSKHEFSEYMDKICAWSEVPLPDPQAVGYLPQ